MPGLTEIQIEAKMHYYFMYNHLAFVEHHHMRSRIEAALLMK
jgi:hypothetical protein